MHAIQGYSQQLNPPVLCRDAAFHVEARYSEDSPVPAGFDRSLGRFLVMAPKAPANGEKAKLKVCCMAHCSTCMTGRVKCSRGAC